MQARRGTLSNLIGGPVLGEGPGVRPLRHLRYGEPVDSFRRNPRYDRRLDGEYAYLGFAFGHFGHIMAEMIHRVLPTREREPDPRWLLVARAAEPGRGAHRLPLVAGHVLKFLGVRERDCEIITEDAVVERLKVSEAGCNMGGAADAAYLEMLNAYTLPRLDEHRRARPYPALVYVSRSALGPVSGYLGERYVEQALAACGYTIYRPENHSLIHQLQTYRHAEVVIFGEGSACHGTELFGGGVLNHAILLNRRQLVRDQFVPLLSSRSRRFDHFRHNAPLGSLYEQSEGQMVQALGVTLFALPMLIAFLRSLDVAAPQDISIDAYLDAAKADLEDYIAHERTSHHTLNTDRADELRENFRKAAAEMRG